MSTEKEWREAADRLWDMPDMADPKPDETLEAWAGEIPYRGQWVVPGVLFRLIERAREEGRKMEQDEKFAIRRAIWLVVLALAIVVVTAAALAHGFGVRM